MALVHALLTTPAVTAMNQAVPTDGDHPAEGARSFLRASHIISGPGRIS